MIDEGTTAPAPKPAATTKTAPAKKSAPKAKPAAAAAKKTHRADAAQAFLAGWLPKHAVSADAFTAADAEALIAAIDAAAKH